MRKVSAVLVLLLFYSAAAAGFFDEEFHHEVRHFLGTRTKIQVGTFRPRPGDTATVVYLHGYADRYGNHEALLTGFHKAGLRVIAFDYPSHGGSEGHIQTWDTEDVAALMKEILASPRFTEGDLAVDRSRPLILAGWSTGGTLAIRTAQSWKTRVYPGGMRLGGVIAFAPALGLKPLIGARMDQSWGIQVLAKDLTRGSIAYGPKPEYTLSSGKFAVTLAGSSIAAQASAAPAIPTLVLVADNEKDYFADAPASVRWVRGSRQSPVYGFQCPGAYHGLEFEPDGIGDWTRAAAIEFAQRLSRWDGERAVRDIERVFRPRTSQVCPAIHQ